MTKDLTLDEIVTLINDPRKGDITLRQQVFVSKEGTIIHYFENLLRDFSGTNFRMIVDEWLLPNILFSSVRKGKLQHVKELLDYNRGLVEAFDSEDQNIFHVLTYCYENSENILLSVVPAFKPKDKIGSIINREDIYGRTPMNLAIKLRKRRWDSFNLDSYSNTENWELASHLKREAWPAPRY